MQTGGFNQADVLKINLATFGGGDFIFNRDFKCFFICILSVHAH